MIACALCIKSICAQRLLVYN